MAKVLMKGNEAFGKATINIVYGAMGAGTRVMISSSSSGMALKQEGITYCAGAEVPCIILIELQCLCSSICSRSY